MGGAAERQAGKGAARNGAADNRKCFFLFNFQQLCQLRTRRNSETKPSRYLLSDSCSKHHVSDKESIKQERVCMGVVGICYERNERKWVTRS